MKKILILLIIVSSFLVGCTQNNQGTGSEVDEVKETEQVVVKTEVVKEHIFSDTLDMAGEIAPIEEVIITSKIGGDVTSINVEIGELVEKDQMLLKFDDIVYGLTLKKAKLGVESAQIALVEAKNYFENNSALYNQNVISKNTFETYEKAYKMAQIGLESAEADYETALENFRYTTVKSPIKGIISSKNISKGENLNIGTHLYTIVNTEQVYVEAGISEMNVNKLKPNMPVLVTLSSIPDKEFVGEVTHIGPVPGATNTYPVKIRITNDEDLIKTGMFANAIVKLGEEFQGIGVPKHVVQHENNEDFVFVVEGDQAKKVVVNVGLQDEDYFEIKDGLNVGSIIIVSGQNIVKSGDSVKIYE